MSGWYDRVAGVNAYSQQSQYPQNYSGIQFQNPIQKANYILEAMRNPAAFVKHNIPDIPENIINDPNKVLDYLQRTRGITNEQINQIAASNPYPRW